MTQPQLDGWFNGSAVDNNDVVDFFKTNITATQSQASFKLVSFPENGNFSYVLIRGTTNPWDALTDAELWSAALLFQVHRMVLPIGEIWTPIIDRLIKLLTSVQPETIRQISFYIDTTAFVNYLKEQVPDTYLGLAVTGHSLGGGLSSKLSASPLLCGRMKQQHVTPTHSCSFFPLAPVITGAQTGIPAVALSGPNSMLSKRSYSPPVNGEDLDRLTFNIIPARDVVPMIDDRAQNFQQIRCEAGITDIVGCHGSVRSLCELIYSCGTGPRPTICECVYEYGYPEPTPKEGTNITFAEACNIEASLQAR